jgi:hypothetical protein
MWKNISEKYSMLPLNKLHLIKQGFIYAIFPVKKINVGKFLNYEQIVI